MSDKISSFINYLKDLQDIDKAKGKVSLFFRMFIQNLSRSEISAIGAEITYNLLLSIFPFFITLLNIISYTQISKKDVLLNILSPLPTEVASIIIAVITESSLYSSNTMLSISALTGIWLASRGLSAMLKGINKAYNTKENRSWFVLRGMALVFTIGLILLLLLSLVGLVYGNLIKKMLLTYFNIDLYTKYFEFFFKNVFTCSFMIIFFTILYKFSPALPKNEHIKIKDALPGAIFSTFSWIAITLIFSWYVNNFSRYAKTYGSLWGVVVLLIWLNLSSNILLLGGEMNATIKQYKSQI